MNDKPTLGDRPIQKEYSAKMRLAAYAIDKLFNGETNGEDRQVGFVLMVFPFGDGGLCNYISNGEREYIIELMKEQLSRLEGNSNNDTDGEVQSQED